MIEGSLKQWKSCLEIYMLQRELDRAVRFDGKNYLLKPNPTKMCIVWQKVPNVELNYMITVLQSFMNSVSDRFAIIM